MKSVEIIKPVCAKEESKGVMLAVLIIILFWGVGVYGRSRVEGKFNIESWQMNVFKDLNSHEQGMYTDLIVAAEEVYQAYLDEDNRWATLRELVEYGTPPFMKDIAWEQRGRVKWQSVVNNNETMDAVYYIGIPEDADACGSFLLMIHQDKATDKSEAPEIWYRTECAGLPDSYDHPFLISSGWKQLVAYKGEDEFMRLMGEVE